MSTVQRVPERSPTQRMQALQRANEIRAKRAELKRDLRSGRASAPATIRQPPEWAQTMTILDLLMAIPHVGHVKAGRLLRQTETSPTKTLGGLTDRQRHKTMLAIHDWR